MKNIIVYTLPYCGHCKELKAFLNRKNIEFKDINVEENNKAAEEIIGKTGQSGFPVIDIGGELIIGFDEKEMEEKLR
ncbi:glutaredoxin family protein [Candidatus Pacearchaeota archaeon]|nr:glutaredoxin family protein [Candidatus Pacearchaeota archaeon]